LLVAAVGGHGSVVGRDDIRVTGGEDGLDGDGNRVHPVQSNDVASARFSLATV
jgi:hypothetical protein